jgi:A/G-specific adenine glycosylase
MKTSQIALLAWYKTFGRHELPWRNTNDVYHIYISEIMLQQTQVKRVMEEYYPQFFSKFPTLQALANAKEEDVLAAWSGLGYYSRARNLLATAKLTCKNFPTSQKELIKLPGIGRYTASAICSFAYHQNVAVVDTNIERVIKRYFGLLNENIDIVWKKAKEFVNIQNPTLHNQAIMDLGSLICLPQNPRCSECPLNTSCLGKNEPELYTQKRKTVYEAMELFYGIAFKNGKIGLKISKGPMYKGLLELPNVEPIEEDFLAEFKHSYTKYRLHVKLYHIEILEDEIDWFDMMELESAHISSLTRKALASLKGLNL